MKLVRVGEEGKEIPGAIGPDLEIRDISSIIGDVSGDYLSNDQLARLREVDLEGLPVVEQPVRYGPCIAGVRNFIAVGLNYADHARETNAAIPEEPVLFSKAATCISGPDDPIVLLPGSTKTDWEVELAFVIGEPAYRVTEQEALDHVAGYCVCNDVSEREWQLERGGQWIKGKSAPTYGPLGPWLVTRDEVADIGNLDMWLDVNGKRMQSGSTSTMIFGIPKLVAYITSLIKLMPGDVVTTGTPPGVGLGMKPQVFLKQDDVVELGIEGLGKQRQLVTVS